MCCIEIDLIGCQFLLSRDVFTCWLCNLKICSKVATKINIVVVVYRLEWVWFASIIRVETTSHFEWQRTNLISNTWSQLYFFFTLSGGFFFFLHQDTVIELCNQNSPRKRKLNDWFLVWLEPWTIPSGQSNEDEWGGRKKVKNLWQRKIFEVRVGDEG